MTTALKILQVRNTPINKTGIFKITHEADKKRYQPFEYFACTGEYTVFLKDITEAEINSSLSNDGFIQAIKNSGRKIIDQRQGQGLDVIETYIPSTDKHAKINYINVDGQVNYKIIKITDQGSNVWSTRTSELVAFDPPAPVSAPTHPLIQSLAEKNIHIDPEKIKTENLIIGGKERITWKNGAYSPTGEFTPTADNVNMVSHWQEYLSEQPPGSFSVRSVMGYQYDMIVSQHGNDGKIHSAYVKDNRVIQTSSTDSKSSTPIEKLTSPTVSLMKRNEYVANDTYKLTSSIDRERLPGVSYFIRHFDRVILVKNREQKAPTFVSLSKFLSETAIELGYSADHFQKKSLPKDFFSGTEFNREQLNQNGFAIMPIQNSPGVYGMVFKAANNEMVNKTIVLNTEGNLTTDLTLDQLENCNDKVLVHYNVTPQNVVAAPEITKLLLTGDSPIDYQKFIAVSGGEDAAVVFDRALNDYSDADILQALNKHLMISPSGAIYTKVELGKMGLTPDGNTFQDIRNNQFISYNSLRAFTPFNVNLQQIRNYLKEQKKLPVTSSVVENVSDPTKKVAESSAATQGLNLNEATIKQIKAALKDKSVADINIDNQKYLVMRKRVPNDQGKRQYHYFVVFKEGEESKLQDIDTRQVTPLSQKATMPEIQHVRVIILNEQARMAKRNTNLEDIAYNKYLTQIEKELLMNTGIDRLKLREYLRDISLHRDKTTNAVVRALGIGGVSNMQFNKVQNLIAQNASEEVGEIDIKQTFSAKAMNVH